ncbi:glutathione S-transferase [Novosphingobium sp. Rr 2-17]|uniref:glutathione S-transferase family protein n=1 Tax=Novosphingobium sp. Rr 2-17 TaxID=555793 RepID=UPI0002698EE1|nr:glutathione S-transferase family protein [Novosphingobium sp. Rr 2-17]EIZ79295.1 glutathione S-transferase [Novosphingobium sp. Rr 2-17]
MGCTLIIGNKNYSSWSMRAWLLLRLAKMPFEEIVIPLYRENSQDAVRNLGGETGLVPVLLADGHPIWDTLAITETLFEQYSQIWPADPTRRARARSYAGEVHSSLNPLRNAMPVNTRGRNRRAQMDAAVRADIGRVCKIWATAGRHPEGPWLFGEFCAADIMFAPVAARFQTYVVTVTPDALPYYQMLLDHPLVAEWLALGAAETDTIPMFELPDQ